MDTSDALLRQAARFAALGHEARLALLRLLLSAHPDGLVVGELQEALGLPASTLSHHLEALRQQGLVEQRREGRFLRCRAGAATLAEMLGFLWAECCSRNAVVSPDDVTQTCCAPSPKRPRSKKP